MFAIPSVVRLPGWITVANTQSSGATLLRLSSCQGVKSAGRLLAGTTAGAVPLPTT